MRTKRIGVVILVTGVLLFMAAGLVLAHGVPLWDPNGVPLCTAPGSEVEQAIVSYNMNGAAVAWTDTRTQATTGKDIYTQYVQSDGVKPWVYTVGATQGVSVCVATGDQYMPVVCESSGNLFYAWVDEREVATPRGKDIYAQQVRSDGSIDYTHWITDGYPVCPLSGDQVNPQIVRDDAGGAIVVWEARQVAGNVDLFAQRLNANGAPQWAPSGAGITVCDVISDQLNQAMIPDGTGGAIMVWEDYRSGSANRDIYAQRVSGAGARVWALTGAPVCTALGPQFAPQLVSDGDQGAIVVWHDRRGGYDVIYAQRVYSNGVVAWVPNGISICTATGDQQAPRIIGVGGEEYVIVWRDYRWGVAPDLFAQRINGAGVILWLTTGITVCAEAGEQAWPTLAIDDQADGTVVVAWQDNRSLIPEEFDIYAQRVGTSGTTDWPANGIPVCTFAGAQEAPVSAADAHSGVIVVWQDNRGRTHNVYGLFGQRIRDYDYQIVLPLAYKQ